jgi:hypothetical protein
MDGDYVFLCGSDLPSLRTLIGLDRLEELSDERLARMDDGIKKFLHALLCDRPVGNYCGPKPGPYRRLPQRSVQY